MPSKPEDSHMVLTWAHGAAWISAGTGHSMLCVNQNWDYQWPRNCEFVHECESAGGASGSLPGGQIVLLCLREQQ